MTGTEEGDGNTTFKQSYYAHDYKEEEKEFIKNKYYDLLFKNEDGTSELEKIYWLAGRYVHLKSNDCDFGLQDVYTPSGSCYVLGDRLYNSNR